MNFSLDLFTIVACSVIGFSIVAACIYVGTTKVQDLQKRRKWIDQLPSFISTLGVLGTFLGITKGLMYFNTRDLENSIPELLDGLKTAFFTSLLGMSGSLILNRMVSWKFDKAAKISEIEKAAQIIIDAINKNHRQLPDVLDKANEKFVSVLSQDDTVKVIRQDVEQLKDDIEEIKGIHQEFKSALTKITATNTEISEELSRLRAVALTATSSTASIDNTTAEIKDNMESELKEMKLTLERISDHTDDIRDNVEDIKNNEY